MQAIEGLKRGSRHDTYLCAAGYLIGEYGAQIKSTPPVEQFKLLQGPFLAAAVDTKVSLHFIPHNQVAITSDIYDAIHAVKPVLSLSILLLSKQRA